MQNLAETLARLRCKAGITQAEVARRMGTTQTAIARLESGRQSPSMQTLQAFARATGFCLEIGFVRTPANDADRRTGCIFLVQDLQDGGAV